MGEARRRKLAGTYPKPPSLSRAELLAMIHEGMALDPDPTLTGCTLMLADGETVYVSAADARRGRVPGRDA